MSRKGKSRRRIAPQPPGDGTTVDRKSERTESGKTEYQDSRLTRIAIEKGWIASNRWPTTSTKSEVIASVAAREGDATLIERATITVHDLLEHDDARIKANGVRGAVAMERQNQIDQISREEIDSNIESAESTVRTPDQQVVMMDDTIPEAMRSPSN